MYKLNVVSEFSAAHRLEGYEGACFNLHGHNWKVRVGITATETDSIGMTIDFGIVKKALRSEMEKLDHKYLNELECFEGDNPTSENIARYLYYQLGRELNSETVKVSEVEIWESDRSSLIYFE